jgi:SagB-type dehydrogenase family enzyme
MVDNKASISNHYHQRTKYDPETIGTKGAGLDWERQPIPFKEYKIGRTFDLKPYLLDNDNLPDGEFAREWQRISHLFFCSYGLTAKLANYNAPIYLRAAPSAGGLYPAEIYLISRGTDLLPPGLYNYQPQSHSLILFWEDRVWEKLQEACFWHSALETTELAIVTTAVFYRSAWRYEDRAYRRICLDTGHLLGNMELAGAIERFHPYFIGDFQDEALDRLLYLESNVEGSIAVIPLVDLQGQNAKIVANRTTLISEIHTDYPNIADGELLYYLHRSTQIKEEKKLTVSSVNKSTKEDKYNFPFCLKVSTQTLPIDWGDRLEQLENTILTRRSTRAYNGEDVSLEELKALLHFTYQPQDYLPQDFDPQPDYFALDAIETFIAVSGVEGLEEGCYYYAPKAQELRQIRFKNFRRELHYLCLGQDLGRDAAVVLFHTADLPQAVAKYGDRVYRYLHLDAGHLGQRLNLAAIHLGLGVSGIGGFFDDRVNEILGIPHDEATLYITTLGRPQL